VTGDSAAPLAERLRPLLRDGDRVACWQRYFYDLPLYLDRHEPVAVVSSWDDPEIPRRDNWQRELWLGRERDPRSRAWLVQREELLEECRGERARCFVVAKQADAPGLEAALPLVRIAEANRLVLLGTRAAAGAAPAPPLSAR
jgi:hypothetical protein